MKSSRLVIYNYFLALILKGEGKNISNLVGKKYI